MSTATIEKFVVSPSDYSKQSQFLNYIGGQWVPAKSGQHFNNINPANQADCIATFPASTEADINDAVAAAQKAYVQWRQVPAPVRGEMLYKAATLLMSRKEQLSREMTREMGKVITEARGDVQEAIDMTFYAAGEGRRQFGQTVPSELQNKVAFSTRVPLGVVGLITPWNFPIAIASWKMMPALICGNTCVLKPSEDTPLLSHRLVEILEEAGIPKGVVNLVHGTGLEAGAPLVKHPDVKLISFTGSTETGRWVNETCAKSLKRVSLELGGKNAVVVMDDANLDLAVDGILWGAFGTTGQRCTATSRVIVHQAAHAQLREKLLVRMTELTLGNGLDNTVKVGPLINEKALEKVLSYIDIGKSEGADLLVGGTKNTAAGDGWFIDPAIFDNVKPTMRIAKEEIFGPVTALIPVSSFEEALAVANSVEYGLSLAIYTMNVNKALKAVECFDSGLCYINAPTIGAEVHLPFGGVKNTGNGHRDAGQAGLDVFSEWKSVYIDYSNTLQRAQIDPVEMA
ncbi:MAG: aldehyde dehydrogenase family protein [Cyanobacteria bacterium P01_H01_bin.74]